MPNNNNNNLFIYSALFKMLGDQKRITTINNLKTIQILEIYKQILKANLKRFDAAEANRKSVP